MLLGEQRQRAEEEMGKKAEQWAEEKRELEDQIAALRGKMMGMKEEARRGGTSGPPPDVKQKKGGGEEEKTKKARKRGSVLGDIDLDEDSDVPISEQLKNALVKNASRVLDLFREWDTDGARCRRAASALSAVIPSIHQCRPLACRPLRSHRRRSSVQATAKCPAKNSRKA